jgi:NADH:ubiquinone oxidoreductase subunit
MRQRERWVSAFGTKLLSWWKGELVGSDSFGNRYYREKAGTRRWVLYHGEAEASKVPPEWHVWLHRTSDDVPKPDLPVRPWQKAHVPNLTGTASAYRPLGHVSRGGLRAPATGDYEAWRPK